jgi:hypothetical protein
MPADPYDLATDSSTTLTVSGTDRLLVTERKGKEHGMSND